MKTILIYLLTIVVALFNGKLVAGAISGTLLGLLVTPSEHGSWTSRYVVPFIQGLAMGFVALCSVKWVLLWFHLEMGWSAVAILIVIFVMICSVLMKNAEERAFHLSAGAGELLAIVAGSYYFLQVAI